MADTTDFYLVEEGIKRNRDSIRLQEEIGLMIWNRAHAELSYLQEIESWKDRVASAGTDRDGKSVFDFVKPALIGEADRAAEIHKNIYDKLMSSKGPYQNILKHTRQEQEKNRRSKLKDIEEEFQICNERRKELEQLVQKQKQSLESQTFRLSDLETKLSKRSRIADGRRSARGMRKLDSINAQVSHLRKRIETTSSSYMNDETELQSLIGNKKKVMKKMFQDLKELDQERLSVTKEVIQQYIKQISPPYDLIRERSREVAESIKALQTVDLKEVHEQNWKIAEDRARLKKAGLTMGFDMFLVTNPSLQTENTKLADLENGATNSKRKANNEKSPCREQKEPPTKIENARIMATCPSTSNTKGKHAMKGPSMLVTELPDNDDDIETIELPPDTRRRLPAPFAVKEFLVHQEPLGSNQTEDKRFTDKLEQEDSLDEDSDESSTGDASAAMLNDESGNEDEGFDDSAYSGNRVIEFDPQTVRLKYSRTNTLPEPHPTLPNMVDGDIGTVRDIRVIANKDYKARNCNELTLKKGQVIKQKIGENEEGFAYGWTRESKLSSKQYGWYPINIVSYK
ncbi:protein kinase C and casein kinase substrate in neurons protein 1 [Magallana gigas]|uniref:protein kinase C and casein kinase substrate in neurons protein 1 n=1 Tax=Magallana gigas TaxID=29159 RepID=UPI00333FF968